MAEIYQHYTTDDMAKVLAMFEAKNPTACILTYGQIYRVDRSSEGLAQLKQWSERLKHDRRMIAKMAKSSSWTETQLNALRALYNSRTRQITDCAKATVMIEELIRAYETIEERIDRYAANNNLDTFGPELPF